MGKRKRGKHAGNGAGASSGAGASPADEEREIAEVRAALEPVLAAGVPIPRIASATGAHPQDMQGFVDGKVSLTWELRRRLRQQIPELLHDVDPNRL